jgi:hypothetical protein
MSKPVVHERECGVHPSGCDRYACAGDGVCGFGPTADDAYADWSNKLRVKQYNDARGGDPVQKLVDAEKVKTDKAALLDRIEQVMIEKGWREKGQTEPPLDEAVGLMIDLVMSLQETKQTLRQRLLECGVVT